MIVTAKAKNGRTVNTEYDFGSNLSESVAKFGEHVVHTNFIQSAKITMQSGMRRMAEKDMSDEQIQAVYSTWKPGVQVQTPAVDPLQAILNKVKAMSPEEKAQFLATFQSQIEQG